LSTSSMSSSVRLDLYVSLPLWNIEETTEANCNQDTSFKPRFPVYSLDGKNLQTEWAHEPRSYLGLAAPYMPNYFQFLGPNCPIGNGPVLVAIEAQADTCCRSATGGKQKTFDRSHRRMKQ
jgi:hypothetical protein